VTETTTTLQHWEVRRCVRYAVGHDAAARELQADLGRLRAPVTWVGWRGLDS
jgi:hypothetical protein